MTNVCPAWPEPLVVIPEGSVPVRPVNSYVTDNVLPRMLLVANQAKPVRMIAAKEVLALA